MDGLDELTWMAG